MTNKDFIKLLLISYGYDENLTVEVMRTDYGDVMYDVHARTNVDGDDFSSFDYFLNTIIEINRYMDERRHPDFNKVYVDGSNIVPVETECDFEYKQLPISLIIDDEKRKAMKRKWTKANADHKAYCEYMHPVWEEDERTRPCHGCTDNPKDLDWANEKCSKHYHMTCQKLRDWMDECKERNKKATEEYERRNGHTATN